MSNQKLPELQDEVKHRCQPEFTGFVIAKYPVEIQINGQIEYFLDVRLENDDIVYKTRALNWETIRTEEERWL